MGIFTRLIDVTKASVHEALDKLEQPGMMMNYYLRMMKEDVRSLEQALAGEEAAVSSYERRAAHHMEQALACERTAAEALADDRGAEARQAVEAKLMHEERAAELMRSCEAARERAAELAARLEQAKRSLSEAEAKREALERRAAEAEAARPAAAAAAGILTGAAARGFRRIEDAILQREFEVEREKAAAAEAAAVREARVQEQLEKLRSKLAQQA